MTVQEMQKEIETLKAINQTLKAKVEAHKKPGTLTLKVSPKCAVSVYGLGRFPVSLYQEQWLRLLEKAEDIRAFIKSNESVLAKKEDKAA
jgi:hypothetical protein